MPGVSRILTEVVPTGPRSQLRVENDAGSIEVLPGEAGQTTVEAELVGPDEESLDGIAVQVTAAAGEVRVGYRAAPLLDAWVNFLVRAPRDTRTQARNASGTIRLQGLTGGADLGSASGDVEVQDASGQLNLHTASGGIRAVRVDGAVEARTASGNIDVGGRLLASSSAESASGQVRVRLAPGSTVSIQGGDLVASSLSGTVEVTHGQT